MDKRLQEIQELKSYTQGIDKEITMIFQTLQWDRNHVLQNPVLVTCKYDSNHKVPPDSVEEHEKNCFLRHNGYSKDDQLLPDPLNLESDTLVKLKKEDIEQIIANASRSDPLFKKVQRKLFNRVNHLILYIQGMGCGDAEPMSLERLQTSYSTDERRAIYDAVVNAAPSCHDLTDLALISGGDEKSSKVVLSRQEILAELRNMRRRRTKYRVAAKSRNYSDVLRDVIKTQMEHYNDDKSETEPKDIVDRDDSQRNKHDDRSHSRPMAKDNEKDRHRYDGKIVPRPIKIKTEREDATEINYRDTQRERSDRYEKGSRDRRDRDNDRREHYDRSKERKKDEDVERTQKYGEHSRKRRYDEEPREKWYYYKDSKDKRKNDDRDKEHRADKRSRKDHSPKDYNSEHQVKIEPGLEEESNNHRGETSRDRRQDEKRDRSHKHKHKKERHRDRSREKRRDNRYEERPSEKIQIKLEREDSVTRDDTNNYEKEKADRKRQSKSRRYDRSHRDGSFNILENKQEKYGRYTGGPSKGIYNPSMNFKEEK